MSRGFNYEPSNKSVQQKKFENRFESVYKETINPSFQEFFPKIKNKFGYRNGSTTYKESLSDFQIDFFMRQLDNRQTKFRGSENKSENKSVGRSFGDRDVNISSNTI